MRKVHEGLLGRPDTAAHKVMYPDWNAHAHPDGRPMHADEALLTDMVEVAWCVVVPHVQLYVF